MASITGTGADTVRARQLAKERDEQKKKFEETQNRIKNESKGLISIDARFSTEDTSAEARFKANTVGLVTAEEYRKQLQMVDEMNKEEVKKQEDAVKKDRKRKEKERKKALTNLTFDLGEDGEEEAEASVPQKKKKTSEDTALGGLPNASSSSSLSLSSSPSSTIVTTTTAAAVDVGGGDRGVADEKLAAATARLIQQQKKKDPTIATHFLPDKNREKEEIELKKKLEREWDALQEAIKKEMVEITYSYWDGSGHRRSIAVNKGTKIDQFLEKCRHDLAPSFHELRALSVENMMYIKEDLIIPHHYSFYDLIATKARGKSGPLFHFDVHDDVRMLGDARMEKDESHAGKIITRGWYERNKHIFPASRWEVYDPNKKMEGYTIHGKEVNTKK